MVLVDLLAVLEALVELLKTLEDPVDPWLTLWSNVLQNLVLVPRVTSVHNLLKRQIFRYARWGMGRSNQDQIDDKDDFIG